MTQIIYIPDNHISVFKCPECGVSKNANVSKFVENKTSVKFNVKCSCGHSYPVIFEKRKYYRKETNFPGEFRYRPDRGPGQKGIMTVLNISRGGIKFKAAALPKFKKDEIVEVEFNLDNKNRSLIKKQVIAKNIKGYVVNAEFCSFSNQDPEDKAIGFYLL